MPCVCEEDAIIIIVLAERIREISLISFCALFFSLDCLWALDARAHVYNKQDPMYVSKMCVCVCLCAQRKKRMELSLFLYRDRMSIFSVEYMLVLV